MLAYAKVKSLGLQMWGPLYGVHGHSVRSRLFMIKLERTKLGSGPFIERETEMTSGDLMYSGHLKSVL